MDNNNNSGCLFLTVIILIVFFCLVEFYPIDEFKREVLSTYYETILLKDCVANNQIRGIPLDFIYLDEIAKFADPVLFKNYDYTDDDPNVPGIGLFNGPMDRFKSVDQFRKHKAARNRRKKKIKDLHDKVSR